jgi:hypothetical protein
MRIYSIFEKGIAGSCFLRLTFHTETIPRDIGISAMAIPFPSRKEKPSKVPATTEMLENI